MAEVLNTVENVSESERAADRERRQRVLKKAIASYSDRSITIECIVRDLSSGGVKLQLTQPLPLPDRFALEIPMDGIHAECQVRWRKGNLLGAVFVGEIRIEGGHNVQKIDVRTIPGMRKSILRKPGK